MTNFDLICLDNAMHLN